MPAFVKRFACVAVAACFVLAGLSGCGGEAVDGNRGTDAESSMASSANKSEATPMAESRTAEDFNTEEYAAIQENDFLETLQNPLSTFSIDVDTAAYANIRRMLKVGMVPPVGAVRLEELVNYFPYDYPEPEGDHPFSVTTEIATCPWQPQHQLLRIGLKGESIDLDKQQPCNLVFLLDVSGSMNSPRKLPLVKSALTMLIHKMRPEDRIAIVVYAGASGLLLDSTPVSNAPQILGALENLKAGGSTNGGEGIQLAYRVAQNHFNKQGVNRVVLCTDGDFNVGISNQSDLQDLIQEKAQSGVFLSVLGFGRGNLKDSTMEMLADKGNGNYSYIDSELEARKVLVEQMGGTLVTIAKDVKIQLDFNPQHVKSYRLLGYENRLLQNRDFRDDSKDAGEIGAGHTVTAFYEIVPAAEQGAGQPKNSAAPAAAERPSEFVKPTLKNTADPQAMLTVNLRYKHPAGSVAREFQVRVAAGSVTQSPSVDHQFASAVLAYGMLLRDSSYQGEANWDWVIQTAEANTGDDPQGIRAEFVELAKAAQKIQQKPE